MKTKITYLIQMPPPNHGAAYINKKIYDSHAINRQVSKTLIKINFIDNLNQIGRLSFKKWIRLFFLIKNLLTHLIWQKPDYIYFTPNCTGVAFFRDYFLIMLIKLCKTNLILHFHGKGIADKSSSFIYRTLYRFAFSHTHLIFVSKLLKETECVRLKLDTTQQYYVENGIDCIHFSKMLNETMPVTKLLFMSTLMPSKGIYVLIDSLIKIKRDIKNFHLNIIGGTINDKELKNIKAYIKKNNMEPYITLWGAIYGEEKYNFFQEADIFIHPTLNEAFGLVILEAMQFGLPVISTYEGGIPDIIVNNSTGLLVEKNNSNALAETIRFLIHNPSLRKQFGESGQQRFLQKYTMAHFEKNMATVLEEIILNDKKKVL